MRPVLLLPALLTLLAHSPVHAAWPTDLATDLTVVTAPITQSGQVGCSDGAGGMIVAWLDGRVSGVNDVYAQRIDANGNLLWAANGIPVCTRPGPDRQLQIISDGAGGAILCWNNEVTARRTYAQRLDANGQALWDPDGMRVSTLEALQDDPRLVTDQAGGAIIVWVDLRANNASQKPIYGQRLDPAGARLWGSSGDSLSIRGSKASVTACSDDAGGAWIAWSDGARRPLARRVFANRTLGPELELTPASFTNQVYELRLLSLGSGDAMVSIDYSTTQSLHAQRLSANGTLPWGTTPVLVCDLAPGQNDARLVSDGDGGAFFTWSVPASPTQGRLQRLSGDGVPMWAPNGIVAWTATSFRMFGIASDFERGCILTVPSQAARQTVHRFDAFGNARWGPTGAQITDRSSNSSEAVVIPTPEGGAMIVWTGLLDGTDLFAKRVLGTGAVDPLSAPGAAPPPGLTIALASANPVRGSVRLELTLATACEAAIDVMDVQGRQWLRLDLGRREAGRHSVAIDPAALPRGVSFIRLLTPQGAVSTRAVRLD